MPLTEKLARQATEAHRRTAVEHVLARYGAPTDIAAEVIAAYNSAEVALADDCPEVHPKYGQCVRKYGHEPFIVEHTIAKTPDQLAKLTNPTPRGNGGEGWFNYEDHRYEGHYTVEHDDPRRPDGSHPWDF